MERLPTSKQIKNLVQLENKSICYQEVAKKLEPLVQFIDFRRIRGQILVAIIEPLEIIPIEIVYQCKANDSYFNDFRGIPGHVFHVWDESGCGSNLIIEDNGKVV